MLKVFYSAALLVCIACSSGCQKCYECNFNGDTREICSKDLPDGMDGLKMTVDAYEDQGYTCEAK